MKNLFPFLSATTIMALSAAAATDTRNLRGDVSSRTLQEEGENSNRHPDLQILDGIRALDGSLEEQLEYAKANNIRIRHTFTNSVSGRVLQIFNLGYGTSSSTGRTTYQSFVGSDLYNGDRARAGDYALTLTQKVCPPGFEQEDDASTTSGGADAKCYTIEHDTYGRMFAREIENDNWERGIESIDVQLLTPEVRENGHPVFLWRIESRGSNQLGNDLVSIRNVAFGRRLFAQETPTLTREQLIARDQYQGEIQVGGSPSANTQIFEDQKWQHCIVFYLGDYNDFDCSSGFGSF